MDVVAITAELDSMEKNSKWREACEYVKPFVMEAVDPGVLWRLLRVYYRVGKFVADSKQEREEVAEQGMKLYDRAIELAGTNFDVQKV